MHITWDAARLFLAVAESGSISGAARTLRVTQSTVSRRLAELEAGLGEPLFLRSVEGVAVTTAGARLLDPVRRMAEAFADVERTAAEQDSGPRGTVRITAPPGIAYEIVAPFAAKLRTALPEVRLEILASINYVDLVRRDADLALRATKPHSRDLVTLASVNEPVGAYATAAYMSTLKRKPAIEDIDWLGWPQSHAELAPNPQLAARIPDFQPVVAADDFLIQLRAAEAGAGAIVLSQRRSRLALPSPLVKIDVDLGRSTTGIHLVCARGTLAVPRARIVAELLTSEISDEARVARL